MMTADHPNNVKRGDVCVLILGNLCQLVILVIHI